MPEHTYIRPTAESYSCGRFKSGDCGQRYEVSCLDGYGGRMVIGWTSRSDGQPFVDMVAKHPIWSQATITNRLATEGKSA